MVYKLLLHRKNKIQEQLAHENTPPEHIARASLWLGLLALGIFVICLIGDFYLQYSIIRPFSYQSPVMTCLLAGLITLLTFKAVANYISAVLHPGSGLSVDTGIIQRRLFLQIGFVALLSIFVVIGLGASIITPILVMGVVAGILPRLIFRSQKFLMIFRRLCGGIFLLLGGRMLYESLVGF